MNVQLKRATVEDAPLIQAMLREAFTGLPEKYQDYDTNPATMTVGGDPGGRPGRRRDPLAGLSAARSAAYRSRCVAP